MSKEIVKYSNKMNNIPLKNFEKVDLNFFHAICAKVREKGSELVEIPLDEIKLLAEYKSTSLERFKSDLIRMNEKLRSCHGIYENDDEIVQFNLFSTFTIRPRSTNDTLSVLTVQYHEYSRISFRLGGFSAIPRPVFSADYFPLVCPLCFSILRLGVQYHE